jgi:hypothetical protein
MIMSEGTAVPAPLMSYGCQYACGNAYHVILINVIDGEILFLCMPHAVSTFADIVKAMTDGISPEVEAERQRMNAEAMPGSEYTSAKRGRHNAPSGEEDPDAVAAFDGIVYEDELDERFQPSAE